MLTDVHNFQLEKLKDFDIVKGKILLGSILKSPNAAFGR